MSEKQPASERCDVSVTGRHRVDSYCKDCGQQFATTGAGAGASMLEPSWHLANDIAKAVWEKRVYLRSVHKTPAVAIGEMARIIEPFLTTPATVAEGELQRCGAFKPSVLGVPEPQDQCTLPDGHEGKHTLAAPAPVQPVAAAQDGCVGCIASQAGVGRCRIHETKPSTATPGEGAREIETRLGVLPLSLIDDIDGRRESIYHGWNYQLDAKVASQMKTDLDYLRAFVGALLSRHFPPTEATQVAVEAAASEVNDYYNKLVGFNIRVHGPREVAAIISKHCTADAGEVERRLREQVARFGTLADERHDLLCAERRKNDDLRTERAEILQSLVRAQQERNRLRKELTTTQQQEG